jgi:TetR/AcrR family transcriptional repressor of mexJK operon
MPNDKQQHIITAAKLAFEEKGYAVSMSDIAKRAGVAKQTLYNHFENKETLFAEVIRDCTADASAILLNESLPLPDKIQAFSFAIRRLTMTKSGIAAYRAMVSQANQFPVLAKSFYIHGVGVVHQQLQDVLTQADQRGELNCPHPALAADMLFSMLTGFERSRLLLGVDAQDDGSDTRILPIVCAFLCAFSYQQTTKTSHIIAP